MTPPLDIVALTESMNMTINNFDDIVALTESMNMTINNFDEI
jgi:hypothetical protein